MTSVTFPPSLGGDGSTVSDDSNPSTGLGNGGHRTRFVPAMGQALACMNGAIAQTEANIDLAADQAGLAAASAAEADESAEAAAASAASALLAPGVNATSTSSLTIGLGSKSLTLAQTGKAFVVNQYVQVVTSPGNWMVGPITAFNSGTGALTFQSMYTGGSGTFASWTITPAMPSALPSPGGSDGMSVVSNGQDFVMKFQIPASLITAAGTLPDDGNYVYAKDVAVTLPDLSTPKNLALTIPNNLAAHTQSALTPDGWSVHVGNGWSAGNSRTNVPQAFGTPHGWWGSTPMTPPLNAVSAAIGSSTLSHQSSVALSSTLHIHTFSDAGGSYAIAVNPVTGAIGAPIVLTAVGTSHYAFAVNATTAVIFGGGYAMAVQQTSGVTIAAGTGQAFSAALTDCPIQLTPTTYFCRVTAASNDLVVVTVTGTTCALGTPASSGVPASTSNFVMAPMSSTAVLIAFPTAATNPSQVTFRVVTFSGTTPVPNTAYTTATGLMRGTSTNPWGALFTINAGSSYVFAGPDNATPGNGNWYGLSVAGTVVTVGAVSVQAGLNSYGYRRRTFIYRQDSAGFTQPSNEFASVNSTTGLFLTSGAGVVAVSISGTSLAFGAPFTTDSPAAILTDVATGANLYSKGSSSYSKLSVSGTTITAAYTIANSPSFVLSDTLTDKAVNYAGTWYTWTLTLSGTPRIPISASKFATIISQTMRTYGSFS